MDRPRQLQEHHADQPPGAQGGAGAGWGEEQALPCHSVCRSSPCPGRGPNDSCPPHGRGWAQSPGREEGGTGKFEATVATPTPQRTLSPGARGLWWASSPSSSDTDEHVLGWTAEVIVKPGAQRSPEHGYVRSPPRQRAGPGVPPPPGHLPFSCSRPGGPSGTHVGLLPAAKCHTPHCHTNTLLQAQGPEQAAPGERPRGRSAGQGTSLKGAAQGIRGLWRGREGGCRGEDRGRRERQQRSPVRG